MKKRPFLVALILVCLLAMSACSCTHEVWREPTCLSPRTCSTCEKTEGEALGHDWADASCETPNVCSRCGKTEGAALGHNWVDASCNAPKTCSICNKQEGDALGHTWLDAATEIPQTCAICGATNAEQIITDPRFSTEATSALQGEWESTLVADGRQIGALDAFGFQGTVTCKLILILNPDGTSIMYVSSDDISDLREYLLAALYEEYGVSDLDNEAASAVIQQEIGIPAENYVEFQLATLDYMVLMAPYNHNGVYYAENGMLYFARTWDEQMCAETYSLQDDTLTLSNAEKGYTLVFTRGTNE